MKQKKTKKPWPTKDAMTQIYEKNLWGGNDIDFYSGTGSHHTNIVKPYLKSVIHFLKLHNSSLVIADLGCGDFNIGRHLTQYTEKFIAVDIVKDLIERNKKHFQEDNLEFLCIDIAADELPAADCIILRQVFQHLSNNEIHQVVKKLGKYQYIILTEHVPIGDYISNKDIISGQGIRLKQNSGINILEAPFNFEFKKEKILDKYVLENNKGQILTKLYKLF